jgi:hypothetical protein
LRRNVSFYEVTPENRHRMVGTEHGRTTFVPLDLVVAAYSMTADRERQERVVFAGPYVRTETSVLTKVRPPGSPAIESLSALSEPLPPDTLGQRVCVPGTSTSADYIRREAPGARVTLVQRNSECVRQLRHGDVDAAVTDAAILGGFSARYPELKLNNITSTADEFWGIGVGVDRTGGDPRIQARRQLVLLALHDLLSSTGQDSWNEAFERDLQPLQDAVKPADGESPQLIAEGEQPTPEGLQPVRRWPWDRSG